MPEKLEMILDPPRNGYYTENISGKVLVENSEPQAYENIQVQLIGFARVEWDERRVFYFDHEDFPILRVFVWRKYGNTSGVVKNFAPGLFTFPFVLPLREVRMPSSLHGSSFVCGDCVLYYPKYKIKYMLSAKIIKSSTVEGHKIFSTPVRIHEVVDINKYPTILQPKTAEVQKTVCALWCASGPIVVKAQVPRTGFCNRRDSIPVEITVENHSSRSVEGITIKIMQLITCKVNQRKQEIKSTITSVAIPATVRPGNTQKIKPDAILVPFTVPTLAHCRMLSVKYFLRITASVPWALNPSIQIPLVVGNVPINVNQD